MIPISIQKTTELIKNSGLIFKQEHEEGRRDSQMIEDVVIDYLIKNAPVDVYYIIPPLRCWYDLEIVENNISYYVNIKAPKNLSGYQADNAGGSWKAIAYVLTGINPTSFGFPKSFDVFYDWIRTNYCETTVVDFYYLVVPKEDVSLSFSNSMKGISYITPNGNNLPFQIPWNKNLEYLPVSDSNNRILSAFYKSWDKRPGRAEILRLKEKISGELSYSLNTMYNQKIVDSTGIISYKCDTLQYDTLKAILLEIEKL